MSKVENVYDSWVERTDRKWDKVYNVSTCTTSEISASARTKAAFDDGTFVWSTPYYQLKKLKKLVDPKSTDVLLDIGCGPGRVCFEFAHSNIAKCIGVELDTSAHDAAVNNQAKYNGPDEKIEFLNDDILNYVLSDETLLFLSNPFGARTMGRLVQNVTQYSHEKSRNLRILYYNPLCHDVIVASSNIALTHVLRGFRKPINIYTVSYLPDD